MSQEKTPPDGDALQLTRPNQYATSTESETSDDVSETSDMALVGTTSVLTGRKRRRRTIIAADQLMRMEHLFKLEQWPGRERKEGLARDIGMSTHFVNIWFQNKRSRMKKLAQEAEELEVLRQTRSPGTAQPKLDPVQSPVSGGPIKPVTIAPKPPSVSSLISSAIRIPRFDRVPVGQCLVVGQRVNINSGATAASSSLPTASSLRPSPTVKTQTDTSRRKTHTRIEIAPSRMPSTPLQPRPPPVSPQAIPACSTHQTESPRRQANGRLNFFKCLVAMMAMEEGGLLKKGDPEYDVAVNAALYGLRIANGNVVTYRKNEGLFIHNDQH